MNVNARILVGDNRKRLLELPDGSVQCVVTSPPYWGLRDYGTSTWVGGDESCEHVKDASKTKKFGNAEFNKNRPSREETKTKGDFFDDLCVVCGAVCEDNQIGLESSPAEFVEQLCLVFDEVWRVLADNGTLWLNLGDTYAAFRDSKATPDSLRQGDGTKVATAANRNPANLKASGLKHKDLVGIPWRVAFALQERGWYLRQDIIWAKPNPMPESVTDRCTKSHEYIFLLTKSPRYFFDNEAIKEPVVTETGGKGIRFGGNKYGDSDDPKRATKSGNVYEGAETRNKRDVWNVATKPYAQAHFATYPPELILPCILAGTSEKGHCASCGKGYSRITQRSEPPVVADSELDRYGNGAAGVHRKVGQAYQNWLNQNPAKTVGWQKPCECDTDEIIAAIVLDPFSGSGTTGEVAMQLGRNYVGCELNPQYAALSEKRLTGAIGMFGSVEIV